VGYLTPSPPSLDDRRFVVVNREEEEVKKKDDKLMEEAGESRGERLGEGVILTRRGTVKRLCPHLLFHYC
jgi:hypothetical protein